MTQHAQMLIDTIKSKTAATAERLLSPKEEDRNGSASAAADFAADEATAAVVGLPASYVAKIRRTGGGTESRGPAPSV